jgi:tetratricopeptide (TPR) repeat protein
MSPDMSAIILKAKELARADDEVGAMLLADQLIAQHPEEMEAWLLRGYLYERQGNHALAAADLTCAIDLNSSEPHLFYSRGRFRFQLGEDESAVEDFGSALELCDSLKNDYYREELHFWRAEALLRIGKKNQALKDLSMVSDRYQTWTYALRSKLDLVRDCKT